jgi:hypothetical protein
MKPVPASSHKPAPGVTVCTERNHRFSFRDRDPLMHSRFTGTKTDMTSMARGAP